MSTERKKTRLEQLQQETDQRNFIKSYPVLNKISKISSTDKQLIELVLAYQDNDQPFKMSFGKIADLLGIESKTVSNIVLKLSALGIVIPDHKANDVVNGVGRGSSTDLAIDIDRIIELVKAPAEPKAPRKPRTKKEPASTPEPIQAPEPTQAVEVEQPAPAETIEPAIEDESISQNLTGEFDIYLANKIDEPEQEKEPEPIKQPSTIETLLRVVQDSSLPIMYQYKINPSINDGTITTLEQVNKAIEEQQKNWLAKTAKPAQQ